MSAHENSYLFWCALAPNAKPQENELQVLDLLKTICMCPFSRPEVYPSHHLYEKDAPTADSGTPPSTPPKFTIFDLLSVFSGETGKVWVAVRIWLLYGPKAKGLKYALLIWKKSFQQQS